MYPTIYRKLAAILLFLCGFISIAAANDKLDWLGPWDLAVSPDESELAVVLRDSGQVAWVDLKTLKPVRRIDLDEASTEPLAAVYSPCGSKLYVACAGPKSTIVTLDAKTGEKLGRASAGHTACDLAIAPDGRRLYAACRFDNRVDVLEIDSDGIAGKVVGRWPAPREPIAIAIAPNGKMLAAANHLPVGPSNRFFIGGIVSVYKTESGRRADVQLPNGTMNLRGICISPDGRFVFATHILGNYELVPSQVENGWTNTNVVSVINLSGKTLSLVNTAGTDDSYEGAANPWGIAMTDDASRLCVAHAGSNELSVIDTAKFYRRLSIRSDAPPPTDELTFVASDDSDSRYVQGGVAGVLHDFSLMLGLRYRVRFAGRGPRAVVTVGGRAIAAEYYSDTLSVVTIEGIDPLRDIGPAPTQIALGPPPKTNQVRRGEMLFNNAIICRQHWQSCASCHPDARSDCLNWDLMNDGVGNPKNTKSMLLSHRTPPAMATGVRPSAEVAVRSGLFHILFADRPESEAAEIDAYLKSLRPVPSPRLVDSRLSEAALRGQELFDEIGCARCHPAPLYTDKFLHKIEKPQSFSPDTRLDTPTLIETWRSAPYMHDGRYGTIRELIEDGEHGKTEKLSESQVDDLVEFVESL